MRNAVAFPAANARMRSSRSGSMGSGVRPSHQKKAASRAVPTARAAMVPALPQPAWPVCTSPQTRQTAPAETSVTPRRSSRAGAP